MSIYEKNGKFYCRFQIDGERKHYLCQGAKNTKDARKIEDGFRYRLQQQQNGLLPKEDKKRDIKLKTIIELYLKYNQNNNKQREPKEKVKAFYSYFGENKSINNIKPKQIEDFRTWLITKKKLSPATVNRYISCLSKAYNLAIDNDLTEINPCSKVKLLQEPKETIKFYTEIEEFRLMKGIKQYRADFVPFVVCAFQTGLRVSNIQYLKWEQVNLEKRIIEILPQDNKGKKLIRLYISDKLMAELIKIKPTSEYVFINPETNGIYVTPNRILSKVCNKIGVKHIGFHGIRHTVGTRLTTKGTPINVVQAVLAHTDIRTTMKYVHLQDSSIKDAIMAL